MDYGIFNLRYLIRWQDSGWHIHILAPRNFRKICKPEFWHFQTPDTFIRYYDTDFSSGSDTLSTLRTYVRTSAAAWLNYQICFMWNKTQKRCVYSVHKHKHPPIYLVYRVVAFIFVHFMWNTITPSFPYKIDWNVLSTGVILYSFSKFWLFPVRKYKSVNGLWKPIDKFFPGPIESSIFCVGLSTGKNRILKNHQ